MGEQWNFTKDSRTDFPAHDKKLTSFPCSALWKAVSLLAPLGGRGEWRRFPLTSNPPNNGAILTAELHQIHKLWCPWMAIPLAFSYSSWRAASAFLDWIPLCLLSCVHIHREGWVDSVHLTNSELSLWWLAMLKEIKSTNMQDLNRRSSEYQHSRGVAHKLRRPHLNFNIPSYSQLEH